MPTMPGKVLTSIWYIHKFGTRAEFGKEPFYGDREDPAPSFQDFMHNNDLSRES